MNYSQRMYSKTELGLPYFPDTTDGATARRHIMVWIKRCDTLGASLPSFLIILAIAMFFHQFEDNKVVAAMFAGIRPAVKGIP